MKPKKKRIAIIGTVGLPARYGGFETLASHLVEDLSDRYELTVYCSGKSYTKAQRQSYFKGARLRYIPLKANGIQSIPYDSLSIIHALFASDVLVILGVAGAWMLPFVRLFTRKKIIISIDGIEWKRDKWPLMAKLYLWWAESMAVKFAHIDISDNESIQNYTAKRYKSLSTVIEYGGDHTLNVLPTRDDIRKHPILQHCYSFKVGRIEPENNIELILSTYASLKNYPLVVVGNWNKSDYGRRLKESYSDHPNILLLDPIYNQHELDLLRSNAHIYIHGHSAGGTNPSLVEAMSLGLPVVAFDVAYNRTTTENRALYFKTSEELGSLLRRTKFQLLHRIGHRMKAIATRRYTWEHISEKYSYLFERVCTLQHKPSLRGPLPGWRPAKMLTEGIAHLKSQQLFYES